MRERTLDMSCASPQGFVPNAKWYLYISAVLRFFKAGGMGSYDPQIIKPPAVLLCGMRDAVENFG